MPREERLRLLRQALLTMPLGCRANQPQKPRAVLSGARRRGIRRLQMPRLERRHCPGQTLLTTPGGCRQHRPQQPRAVPPDARGRWIGRIQMSRLERRQHLRQALLRMPLDCPAHRPQQPRALPPGGWGRWLRGPEKRSTSAGPLPRPRRGYQDEQVAGWGQERTRRTQGGRP